MNPLFSSQFLIRMVCMNLFISRGLLSSPYVSCPPSTTITVCCAAAKGGRSSTSIKTSSVGTPFEKLKNKFNDLVPCLPHQSLARQIFSHHSEDSINQHINVEYNVSYVYHAMYAYFDRDNVGLKGLANFFKKSSDETREHAERFMEYQNKRGGKVKLHSILMPLSEFDHPEKGEALHAMELALSLEKLTNEKLLHVYEVATRNNDVHLAHFVKVEFLGEQVLLEEGGMESVTFFEVF